MAASDAGSPQACSASVMNACRAAAGTRLEVSVLGGMSNFFQSTRYNCGGPAVRDARPLTPSPRRGEGRDEGAPAVRYGIIVAPTLSPSEVGSTRLRYLIVRKSGRPDFAI